MGAEKPGAPLVPRSPWASPQGPADLPSPASRTPPRPAAGRVQRLKIALEETRPGAGGEGQALGRAALSAADAPGGGDTVVTPRPAAPPTSKGRAARGRPARRLRSGRGVLGAQSSGMQARGGFGGAGLLARAPGQACLRPAVPRDVWGSA